MNTVTRIVTLSLVFTTMSASAELTGVVSLKEMLISGPPQLKMHALAMITQNKVQDEVDESYLPALRACANDESAAIRMVAAGIIGDLFIKDKLAPSTEAIELLHTLAKDHEDVRFTALNKGLCEIQPKSEALIATLIDVAASERDATLLEKIKHVIADEAATEPLLNARLAEVGSVRVFLKPIAIYSLKILLILSPFWICLPVVLASFSFWLPSQMRPLPFKSSIAN